MVRTLPSATLSRALAAALAVAGLAVAVPAVAGLFGSDAPGRIPVPARPFAATIEDVGGTRVRIDRMTFDGEVYLFGTVGRALVTVPFESITSLEVRSGPDDDHRTAAVATAAGEAVEVVLEADRPFFGRTTFGNYRIEVSDVLRVSEIAAR